MRDVGEQMVYTDDAVSFETGTALVVSRIRVDHRVATEVVQAVFNALQPFADHARPLDISRANVQPEDISRANVQPEDISRANVQSIS